MSDEEDVRRKPVTEQPQQQHVSVRTCVARREVQRVRCVKSAPVSRQASPPPALLPPPAAAESRYSLKLGIGICIKFRTKLRILIFDFHFFFFFFDD